MSKTAIPEKVQWAVTIAGSIVIGAVAALLVAGSLGVNETGVSTVHVSGVSQVKQAP